MMELSYTGPFGPGVSGRTCPLAGNDEQLPSVPAAPAGPVIPLPDAAEEADISGAVDQQEEPAQAARVQGVDAPGMPPGAAVPLLDAGEQDSSPHFAHVRFLNALSPGGPMRAALDSRLLTSRLPVGRATGYSAVLPGFHTLCLFDAGGMSAMLYCAPVPFSAGERVTLAAVPCASGVDLVRVDDGAHYMRGTGRACVRAVDLVYNAPPLDVALTDGRVVFGDVRFKEVTLLRRARAAQHDMYIAPTPYVLPTCCQDMETAQDLPAAVANYSPSGYGVLEPLASFYLEARAGAMHTIYLIGNWDVSHSVEVRIAENY